MAGLGDLLSQLKLEDIFKVVFTEEDKKHCGLQGIDELEVLYRVCRDDEDIYSDIVCKAVRIPVLCVIPLLFTSDTDTAKEAKIPEKRRKI
jgi:hypothetical protein